MLDLSPLYLGEWSGGLSQEVHDIGYIFTPYLPAEYPHMKLAIKLSILLALQDDNSGKGCLA